jgi:uncharacterized membrane protein YedE/YeeE
MPDARSATAPAALPTEPVVAPAAAARARVGLLTYGALGVGFGFVLVRAELVSWFRMQEMFRFQAFHMYGVFASALAVAVPAVALLERRGARTVDGAPVHVPPKRMGRGLRYALGGLIFGVGWALTGACPGPLLALVGAGVGAMPVALASALAGTWLYGVLRGRLPH